MCLKSFLLIYISAVLQLLQSDAYNSNNHHHQSGHDDHHQKDRRNLIEVFSWKQLTYNFDGKLYLNDTAFYKRRNDIEASTSSPVPDKDKFFIQYNNVPIGFEVYRDKVFVTVPRRRHGIPSTLNYVTIPTSSSSAPLRPQPGSSDLVSVYRPRVDDCGRLWVVDTGLLEVPGERVQRQPPSIVVYDLQTNRRLRKYQLKPSDLLDERTSGGLTSITVDTSSSCADAFAYITDLATEGLIVYSWRQNDSWRIQHDSFKHDEGAVNFTVAGYTIPWKDGLFSLALSNPDHSGGRVVYYHALASTNEYAVNTEFLKKGNVDGHVQLVGNRGASTQSGSHAYHGSTNTVLFANVARDAILCWNVDNKMAPENIGVVAQDSEKLVYISDLKVVGDEVWVLVNQIPVFVYSALNTDQNNFYIHRGNIEDLIRGTACDRHHHRHDHR